MFILVDENGFIISVAEKKLDENFIEESDKESIAGDKKTRSYRLV